MFRKILFPVDFTDNMNRILPFVLEMADKFQSEIHCVNSLHVSAYYANIGMGAAYVGEFEASARAESKNRLDEFVSKHLAGRHVEASILIGKPGHEIVDYARKNHMDLIIMGHSATGLERAVMGSVAAHVVKYSPVPVLVISPEVMNK